MLMKLLKSKRMEKIRLPSMIYGFGYGDGSGDGYGDGDGYGEIN